MDSRVIFRKATSADRESVCGLYDSVRGGRFCTWSETYPTEIEVDHDLLHDGLYVLEDCGHVIGSISIVAENELDDLSIWQVKEDSCELARVAVSPDRNGNGYGGFMVEKIESILTSKGCRSIHLLAAIRNTPAVKTYLKRGYKICGEEFIYGHHFYACEKVLKL